MLPFINLKKEFKMLKSVLSILILLITFSVADIEEQITYENINNQENLILKLKLKIYELKEKNGKLQKVIDSFNSEEKEKSRRSTAIAQLKRDLRKSRQTRSGQLLLLR
jgi:septal ring factor EnvC (AmiA/AmiB activator)